MVISKKLEGSLNTQLNFDLYSAYLYLSMAAYTDNKNLKGFSHWLKLQAKEELGHAMKFYNFITERGGNVELFQIEKPKSKWNDLIEMFNDVYEHEKKVTQKIYDLYEISQSEKDFATSEMLQWFIKEQVEEEAKAQYILEQLKMMKDSINGILMLDSVLSKRED